MLVYGAGEPLFVTFRNQ